MGALPQRAALGGHGVDRADGAARDQAGAARLAHPQPPAAHDGSAEAPRRSRRLERRQPRQVKLRVKRLDRDLPLPRYARASDAGLDLYAAERAVIEPGARTAVGTGLAIEIPPGYAGFVLPRSGLALRH